MCCSEVTDGMGYLRPPHNTLTAATRRLAPLSARLVRPHVMAPQQQQQHQQQQQQRALSSWSITAESPKSFIYTQHAMHDKSIRHQVDFW